MRLWVLLHDWQSCCASSLLVPLSHHVDRLWCPWRLVARRLPDMLSVSVSRMKHLCLMTRRHRICCVEAGFRRLSLLRCLHLCQSWAVIGTFLGRKGRSRCRSESSLDRLERGGLWIGIWVDGRCLAAQLADFSPWSATLYTVSVELVRPNRDLTYGFRKRVGTLFVRTYNRVKYTL